MISGISFQPTDDKGYNPGGQPRSAAPSNPVQEAIKVLSLRLPKVVGAQGMAPSPLLTSQGSGGNARVDSVVNQVLARMFGEGEGQPQAAAPSVPPSMPNAPTFSGDAHQGFRGLRQEDVLPNREAWRKPPQIIVDEPNVGAEGKRSPFGSLPGTDGTQPPGSIAPAPMWPQAFSLPDKPEPVFEF